MKIYNTISKIKKSVKQLFCKHDYATYDYHNLYGGYNNGECKKCGHVIPKKCDNCIRKNVYGNNGCPNSSECYALTYKPFFKHKYDKN